MDTSDVAEPDIRTPLPQLRGWIVDRRELAEIFGVKPQTIGEWQRKGLPAVREPDPDPRAPRDRRRWLFNTAECIGWHACRSAQRARFW